MIVINNPSNVLIDGVNVGSIADVLRNMPNKSSDVQNAMAAYWTAQEVAKMAVADEHKAELDAAMASSNATLKAATDQIVIITPLQAQNDALVAQLAGKAGEYKITTNALQEVAILVAGGPEWLNKTMSDMLDTVVVNNQQALVDVALAKFPTVSDDQKAAILTIIDADYLIDQPLEKQLAALKDFGLARFLALSDENKAIIAAMIAGTPTP